MSVTNDEDIIGKLAVQNKEEIQDMIKSDSSTEIVWLIIRSLVSKFGNNKLKYDPHRIMSKLRIQNKGSFKKSHAPEKYVRCTLCFLIEDISPHKLILIFL